MIVEFKISLKIERKKKSPCKPAKPESKGKSHNILIVNQSNK